MAFANLSSPSLHPQLSTQLYRQIREHKFAIRVALDIPVGLGEEF